MQVSSGAFDYNTAIRNVVKEVADKGLSVISYASGRKDQLDVAVRRAVLTGVSQTTGMLTEARMDEMGVDLVQTSAHIGARNKGDVPENHEKWQGRIFSRTGSGGYPNFYEVTGYGTVTGLYGINCVTGDTLVSGFSKGAVYRREYSGELIVLKTASGKELTITPNHPILTDKGWVAAGLLNKGDNVIGCSSFNGKNCISPNVNEDETPIQNIFDSLFVNGNVVRLPGSAGHFHGDVSDGEINIVYPESFLRNRNNPAFFKKIKKLFFGDTPKFAGSLLSNSAFTKIVFSSLNSSDGIMGRLGQFIALFWRHSFISLTDRLRSIFGNWHTKIREIFSYSTFGNTGLCSDFIFPHTGPIHFKKIFRGNPIVSQHVGLPVSTGVNSFPLETIDNSGLGTPIFISNGRRRRANIVQADNITHIERKSTQGSFIHVYNLETKNGWYFANGIITHNCRHSHYAFYEGISEQIYNEAVLQDYASKTVIYNGREMSVYEATQQQRYIERQIRHWKRQEEGLKAAGLDATEETAKVREWQGKMRDFIKQTGLQRQSERERISYTSNLVEAAKKINFRSKEYQYVADLGDIAKYYSPDDPGINYVTQRPVIYNQYAASHLINEQHNARLTWLEQNQDGLIKALQSPDFLEIRLRLRQDGHYSSTQIAELMPGTKNEKRFLAVAVSLSNDPKKGYHQITTVYPATWKDIFYTDGKLKTKYKLIK